MKKNKQDKKESLNKERGNIKGYMQIKKTNQLRYEWGSLDLISAGLFIIC